MPKLLRQTQELFVTDGPTLIRENLRFLIIFLFVLLALECKNIYFLTLSSTNTGKGKISFCTLTI